MAEYAALLRAYQHPSPNSSLTRSRPGQDYTTFLASISGHIMQYSGKHLQVRQPLRQSGDGSITCNSQSSSLESSSIPPRERIENGQDDLQTSTCTTDMTTGRSENLAAQDFDAAVARAKTT
nr:hypothetical protein CFP56_73011 [Quercus suber]